MTSRSQEDVGIHTAVCLIESDKQASLEEPLLEVDAESQTVRTDNDISHLYGYFRCHGLVIGFLAQVINVSGTTYMYYEKGGDDLVEQQDFWDQVVHYLVLVLSQVDLFLYVCMWLCLTFILTRSGMEYVRSTYFDVAPPKRSIFVLGVQFYIGVVLGVFLAWTVIDLVLGLPVPLLPMGGVVGFGLLISYSMVWCYDLEDEGEDDDDDDA
jgi:hypothetical protein